MLVLLPVVCFCLWISGFRRAGFGWRRSLVYASIPCSLICVYSTELLSVFHGLTRLGVSISWLLGAGLSVGWLAYQAGDSSSPVDRSGFVECEEGSSGIDRWERAALCVAAGLAMIAALDALLSAPNTWDAMAYHLPRVVEWIGNKGVQNYPTIDRQQLTMPPLAEYGMMHLYLLFGTDRLVNLVQWLAYVGCIVGVSLVTEEFGGSGRTQAFAGVLAATIPTALLGASGAKNDNVLSYWIVLTIYFLVAWKRDQSWWLALAVGVSGALAAFTKGTAYTFMPCLILGCWMMWGSSARRRFVLRMPVLLLLLLSICGPLWARNYRMIGSVFGLSYFDGAGDVEGRKYANSHLGVAQAVAGVLRNGSLNLSVPSERVNDASTQLFDRLIWAVGVDPNDFGQMTRSPNGSARPFRVHWEARDEIMTANQLTFFLFVVACALYVAHYKTRNKDIGWLMLGIAGAFVMYCTLLRWAPWNGRYQLALLMLSAVVTALVLTRFWSRLWVRMTMFALLILSLPLATMNGMRPLISRHGFSGTVLRLPREQTYFLDDHQRLADSFIAAANSPSIKSCRLVGLDATLLHFEYPMMAMIKDADADHRFEYLSVNNPTAAYRRPASPQACVVVCLECAGSLEKLRQYGANPVVEKFGEIVVFSNNGDPVRAALR